MTLTLALTLNLLNIRNIFVKKSREKNTGILIIRNTFHLTLTLNSLKIRNIFTKRRKKTRENKYLNKEASQINTKTNVEKHTKMAKEISNKNRKATMEELFNAKAATKELFNTKAAMEKEKRNFGIPEEDYTVIFDEQAPKVLIVISDDDDDSSKDEKRRKIFKRRGKENIPVINISDDSSEDSSDNDSSEDSSDNEDYVFHQKL